MFVLLFLALDGPSTVEHEGFEPWNLSEQKSCRLVAQEPLFESNRTKIFIKGDLVNLREGPSTNSTIISEIRLGTEVNLGSCEKY